ncbi:MAG: cation diffusion facilitator family transporter [Candidatus Methanomethylophilaceae archaeon]
MADNISGSRENFRIQIVVVTVGTILMVTKFVAYFMTNSVAIFTDAMESIVNVIAGLVGLYALFISPKPPDKDHPYGHGRVEVISAAFEGMMILGAGLIIIFSAVESLYNPKPLQQLDYGLIIIFIAALVNLAMGRTAIRIARKNRSQALEASGKHLCTDTLDSMGIIAGLVVVVVGMHYGYNVAWLDPVMAILFGAFIMTTGARVLKGCIDNVMERAEEDTVNRIVECLREHRHDDWIDIHALRVMKFGTRYVVEFHATFPRNMTVGQIEDETRELEECIIEKFGDCIELTVKSEPCRDFSCKICNRECDIRDAKFGGMIEWNEDNIVRKEQHSPNDE